jgi:hypothetical protein
MTSLVVRKIPWDFDATVPFMWQPANPNFGLFCNAFTFIAVPFERYIVAVVRKAADRLNQDPDVAAEADAFLRQEATQNWSGATKTPAAPTTSSSTSSPSNSTRPTSPTSRRRSRRCSKSFWTTGIHCSVVETEGSRR